MWSEGVEKADNVFMVDEFHELEFAVSSLGVRHILKWTREFFYGAVLSGNGVVGRAYNPLSDEGILEKKCHRGRLTDSMYVYQQFNMSFIITRY